MQTQLRYREYYGMTERFDELYEKSKQGTSFKYLYDTIVSRENILLAYRTIKNNKGSSTAGSDGRTIRDFQNWNEDKFVRFIQKRLENYQPMKVRRVFIPKPNGDKRPIGIPSMSDRIIQQAFKQVLEPICEARFYNHSYGFRPLRSTHHALSRVNSLINLSQLHYAIDVDIKGFFDNVNHTLLLKQLWNLGIQDRKVLRLIGKMLKAEIDGEGKPTKGTPQGGILSPLLSNVVLHDLDMWIYGQWEGFQTQHIFSHIQNKYKSLKGYSNLKEGYIVRYADDFKILCRTRKSADKWFHAVKLYLKDRLKLDISPEKSQVINLRKRKSEFLGFSIKAERKGKKCVAYTRPSKKKMEQYKEEGRKRIIQIQKSPTAQNALLYNSWVLGIHNYSRAATHVFLEFNKLAYTLSKTLNNRLKQAGKYERPKKPPPSYSKFYKTTYKTYKIGRIYLYPLTDVSHKNVRNFSQHLTTYTKIGRVGIHKELSGNVLTEISRLMMSNIPNRSIEYMDNRISRYSMKKGYCEITGEFLPAELVHCHHYVPIYLGGTDEFNNLRILNKDIHILIHAVDKQTIKKYIDKLHPNSEVINKINNYRKMCNLESIS
ncbi:group II intron reverse transcriptase/maturase [Cytobacillus praedii]|uniref:group II intron reverse transcriptase/maturase n=1 Tax=Cytobacillus praedii TaxID=1742358 RepID=UPI002E1A07B1|nr:group II intron reverse transcriptase/maturase [Cytobacillus praedii]MED3575974.1 group II intron reverse transcriptase/maturase [Cytobacillus praedii]